MKFGVMTRGSKKIYISLMAECPSGGRLVAKSICSKFDELPAIIVEKNVQAGEYVIILAGINNSQTVMVQAVNEHGDVEEEISCTVNHAVAALTSKKNTLLREFGIEDIRNIDSKLRTDTAQIHVERMNRKGYEGSELEHIDLYVTAPCPNDAVATGIPGIALFDHKGKRVPIERLTVMGDEMETPVPTSGFRVRTIRLTFMKPEKVDQFYIWSYFEEMQFGQALLFLDKDEVKGKRHEFEGVLNASSQGGYYEEWFRKFNQKSPMELEAQRHAKFEIEPLFSVIVPLYKTPIHFFEEMAQSVLCQTYPKLELILVNSTPEDKKLRAAVERYQSSDSRVRVVTLDKNYGISGNTNAGIKAAQGDFLSFFDHDDVLEPGLLYEYVEGLNKYPETDLFYCDEDKLKKGHYIDGYLKPDFGWELLTACNYICHLLTVRKSIVDDLELSTNDLDGAQDWDMTMKVAERARNVFHARNVLYHWRIHSESTAGGSAAKTYTHSASEIALYNHFERIGIPVHVSDGPVANMHRIDYVLPEKEAKVSIIIPNKDQISYLSRCLESILEKTTYTNYEILIVENNSTEADTFVYYDRVQAEHENIKVIYYEGGFNFSAICNYGARRASGEYYLFLNNDTEVITPNWLERMLGPFQRDEVAVVGAKLLYPDDTIQHVGVCIPRSGPAHICCMAPRYLNYYFVNIRCMRDVIAVTGACLMVSSEDFESIDGFDERFVVAYNDVDFCLRLREKGKHIIIDPNVELYHYESVSRGFDVAGENRIRITKELGLLQIRWNKYIGGGDPTYGMKIDKGSFYYGLDWGLQP